MDEGTSHIGAQSTPGRIRISAVGILSADFAINPVDYNLRLVLNIFLKYISQQR